MEGGEGKGCGFACAGLGTANEVAACQGDGNRFCLDGSRVLVTRILKTAEQDWVQLKAFKRHQYSWTFETKSSRSGAEDWPLEISLAVRGGRIHWRIDFGTALVLSIGPLLNIGLRH